MSIQENDFRETDMRLRQEESPPIDAYEAFEDRENEMRRLDIMAIVVGTIMALGPLSVYSVFGS